MVAGGRLLPAVIIHNAVSLDGRTLGFEPNLALFYSLAGTWHEDLTLAGSETILAAGQGAGDPPADEAQQLDGGYVWLRYRVKS